MPIALVRSFSPPNLKIYTTVSLLLVSLCFYYAFETVRHPDWMQTRYNTSQLASRSIFLKSSSDVISVLSKNEILSSLSSSSVDVNDNVDTIIYEDDGSENRNVSSRSVMKHLQDVLIFMSHEPICIWVLINMAYCCLFLVGKFIQKIVFGDLRISEQQHMKDKFWNFIFYKFIFIFGIVNVQHIHEIVLWITWFSCLGFLHIMTQLSKDRFEYLSFSPTTPRWSHFRLILLLSSIFVISVAMIIVSIVFGIYSGINVFAFMGAECFILSLKTLHILIRYGMFLYDMRRGVNSDTISWDKRGPISYYIEFGFELAALLIDLSHHVHMLLWSNIFLSMASLVIIMQLRYLTNEIQRKFKKHRNYLWVYNHMEKNYPLATENEILLNSDNCAICWEKMERARKLPCGHLFHTSCLQSWLEQDTSCPTCRLALSVHSSARLSANRQANIDFDELEMPGAGNGIGNGAAGNVIGNNNHFFHFNGQRFGLPNFSVEVSNINSVLRNANITATVTQAQQQTSQLRSMARHIQEMFPRFPLNILISDLQTTHSIEHTIDNILEGRLVVPRILSDQEGNSSQQYPSANDYYLAADDITPTISPSNSMSSSSSSSSTSSATTVSDQYEIEQHGSSLLFGNNADLLRDDSPDMLRTTNFANSSSFSDINTSRGVMTEPINVFSTNSLEREVMLQKRKEQMLMLARKKFLEKAKKELNLPSPSTSQTSNVRLRRPVNGNQD